MNFGINDIKKLRIMEKNEITIDEIDVDLSLISDVMKFFIENKVDVSECCGSEAETRIDYIESLHRVGGIFLGLKNNGSLVVKGWKEVK